MLMFPSYNVCLKTLRLWHSRRHSSHRSFLLLSSATHRSQIPPKLSSPNAIEIEVDGIIGEVELVGEVVEEDVYRIEMSITGVVNGDGEDVADVEGQG